MATLVEREIEEFDDLRVSLLNPGGFFVEAICVGERIDVDSFSNAEYLAPWLVSVCSDDGGAAALSPRGN